MFLRIIKVRQRFPLNADTKFVSTRQDSFKESGQNLANEIFSGTPVERHETGPERLGQNKEPLQLSDLNQTQ